MTENELKSQIAGIQSSLRHIERQMEQAHQHRVQVNKDWSALTERVARLETTAKATDGLPGRVSSNEAHQAVLEAVREERQQVGEQIRRTIFAAIAASAGLAATISTIAAWVTA